MTRFEYRFMKETSFTESMPRYQGLSARKVAEAAEKCDINKFALFFGHGYWLKEVHDIMKIEFSCTIQLTNQQIKDFTDALDKAFDYGENTVFVVYTEVDH